MAEKENVVKKAGTNSPDGFSKAVKKRRRDVVSTLLGVGGAVGVAHWSKPIITATSLPAHAATSASPGGGSGTGSGPTPTPPPPGTTLVPPTLPPATTLAPTLPP